MIHLTLQARAELKGDEALVFDWHRFAICCAVAGEVSLRRAPRTRVEDSRSLVPLPSSISVSTPGCGSTRTALKASAL